MSQRRSEYPRQDGEDYRTPAWVAAALTQWLCKRALHVWEPAAGEGALYRALAAEGFKTIATADDFLQRTALPHDRIDAIVTNPPYGEKRRNELATEFIRHALTFPVRVVAMLLTVDFDSAKTRVDLFRDCPRFVGKIVLLDRIVWFDRPGAAPSTNHAWFVWEAPMGFPWIRYAGKAA